MALEQSLPWGRIAVSSAVLLLVAQISLQKFGRAQGTPAQITMTTA